MKLSATSNPAVNALAGMALLVFAGCSAGQFDRLAVKGLVMQDAEPVERGSISFIPAEGSNGPSATAGITDGRYQFDKSNGPLAGHYKVVIAVQSPEKKLPEPGAKPGDRQSIEPWSGEAEITAEELVWDFDISIEP